MPFEPDLQQAERASDALRLLAARIAELVDVEWDSPAAVLYRNAIADRAADCRALADRLSDSIPFRS